MSEPHIQDLNFLRLIKVSRLHYVTWPSG